MRELTIAVTAAVFLTVACDKQPDGPPYDVAVYDRFGSFVSPSRNWKIELGGDEPGISVMRDVSDRSIAGDFEGTSSVSPSDWHNKDGFLCLVAHDDRVWAFDGGKRVWIVERLKDGTRSWGSNFPGEVPSEFIAKLPSEVANQFAGHAGTGQAASSPESK